MGYYVGNGVYDYLFKCDNRANFYWTSRELWLLVYGNENSEPKVITVASKNRLGGKTASQERDAVRVAQQIARGTHIPVNFVRFSSDENMEKFQYWEPKKNDIEEISSEALKNKFMVYGLKMNANKAHKSINKTSSSGYQDWQRENMGNSVVAVDIDLLRYQGAELTEIIELKRSYKDCNEWEPYPEDNQNFRLLSKLAEKRGLGFYIVYNRRTETPFYDDVSKLKIFLYDHRMEKSFKLLGYRTIQQFAENAASGKR